MKATWMIRSIMLQTEVTYDQDRNALNLEGVPIGSNNLSITDVLKGLSKIDLEVPSVISSFKARKVLAQTTNYKSSLLGQEVQMYK